MRKERGLDEHKPNLITFPLHPSTRKLGWWGFFALPVHKWQIDLGKTTSCSTHCLRRGRLREIRLGPCWMLLRNVPSPLLRWIPRSLPPAPLSPPGGPSPEEGLAVPPAARPSITGQIPAARSGSTGRIPAAGQGSTGQDPWLKDTAAPGRSRLYGPAERAHPGCWAPGTSQHQGTAAPGTSRLHTAAVFHRRLQPFVTAR